MRAIRNPLMEDAAGFGEMQEDKDGCRHQKDEEEQDP